MRNLLDPDHAQSDYQLAGRPMSEIISRLDALMMVLKSCKGRACTEPWRELHPDGDVRSLIDSLAGHFDTFYQVQPKVSFTKCELGYIRDSEGPMDILPFTGGNTPAGWEADMKRLGAPTKFKYQGGFSLWT